MEDNNRVARVWFKQANKDLEAGRLLYSNGMPAHAMFFAQDAVEKAVKGTFLHFNIALKKEHFFKKIYKQTRYPDAFGNQRAPVDAISAESAMAMLDIAEAALNAGEKLLELDPCRVRESWKSWLSDPIAVKQLEGLLEIMKSNQASFTGPSRAVGVPSSSPS